MYADSQLSITLGIVKDVNDPLQQGRVRIYCPTMDAEDFDIDELAWATYVTPFGGVTRNITAGVENQGKTYGQTPYGFWSIPKVGAQVVVYFLNADPNTRFWAGCIIPVHSNRGLPGGRGYNNSDDEGPWSDSYEALQPTQANLAAAGLDSGTHYFSRGGYERQVAQAKTDKDGTEGYGVNPNLNDPAVLDPQTYCWTTPGHHFISLQDTAEFCRIRVKTVSGNQMILDDTNERIYVSTAKGKSWIEMDQDGHIHIFGHESISMRSKGDLNFYADRNVNIEGKQGINLNTPADMFLSSGGSLNIKAGGSVLETAGSTIELNAGGNIIETGSQIHLNGPGAASAASASSPSIKPDHEPWTRPGFVANSSQSQRNENWKP